nr:ribonuclease H-like domain-containing protein [Tanacetum cinerariifolium]
PKTSNSVSKDIPNELKEYSDALLVKDRVSDNKNFSVESPVVVEKKTVVPTIAKVKVVRPKQQEKPVRKTVRSFKHVQDNCNYHQRERVGHLQKVQEDQGYVDSGCSRHITGNMSYLPDFKEFNRGYVTFGGGANSGRITGKGTIKTVVNAVKENQVNAVKASTFQEEEGEGSGHPSEPQPPPSTAQPTNEEPIPNIALSSHQKTQTPRQALNKVTELPQTSEPIPNVADEAVYEEWDNRVERAATTTASLNAEQDSGGSPRCQEAMGGSIAQTGSKRVPTPPYDSPLLRVHTPKSDKERFKQHGLTSIQQQFNDPSLSRGHTLESTEDSIELIKELMETCTKLSDRGKVTTTQVSDQGEAHSQEYQPKDQFRVLSAAKVLADAVRKNIQTYTRRRRTVKTGSGGISTASRLFSTAGASMPVSTTGMIQRVNISIPSQVAVKDKGKGKMKKYEDEQTKTTRLQARVKTDEKLAQRLQAEERNKYNKVDQAKMLVDLINQRKR